MNTQHPIPSHRPPLQSVTALATALYLPLAIAPGAGQAEAPDPYPGADTAEAPQNASPARRWSVRGGGIYQWNTDLDSGGDFSSARLYLQGGATRSLGNGNSVGVAVGYGRDEYDFGGGNSGLGAVDPWDSVNSLSVSVPVRWRANEQWTVFAVPSLHSAGESGADFGDSLFGGLLAGASYRFSDNLSIGPGLGVFSNIEDGANVFPVLLVDWQPTERLRLRTGRGLAASRGPGLTLEWKPASPWTLG